MDGVIHERMFPRRDGSCKPRHDVERVDAVLLADGWHAIHAKSFDLDSYEYMHGDLMLLAERRQACFS
jgi:hypothetical protein